MPIYITALDGMDFCANFIQKLAKYFDLYGWICEIEIILLFQQHFRDQKDEGKDEKRKKKVDRLMPK